MRGSDRPHGAGFGGGQSTQTALTAKLRQRTELADDAPLTPGTRRAEARDTDQVGAGAEGSGPAWSSSRTLCV